MIKEIKQQTQKSIYDYLYSLGSRKDIFSAFCASGFTRCIESPVYFYTDGREILLVQVDDANNPCSIDAELPDEEFFLPHLNVPPLWFTDCSHRVSPVYLLNEAASLIKKSCLLACLKVPNIWSVILERRELLEHKDFEPIWKERCTSVFCQLENFNDFLRLKVNDDREMYGIATYYYNYTNLRDAEVLQSSLTVKEKHAIEKKKNFGCRLF